MPERRLVELDGSALSIQDVVDVAFMQADVRSEARTRGYDGGGDGRVDRAGEAAVYGLNTGFGSLSRVRIGPEQLEQLQTNIVRSHAAGVGEPLCSRVVQAMMTILAASLARGLSGVRPEIVERLGFMLANDIVPVVPSRGSVGASGDLAPLAHIARTLLGEGHVRWNGRVEPTGLVLTVRRTPPLRLTAKEGLALLNGTHLMTACGVLALHEIERIIEAATIATAMSLDACQASHGPLDARIHEGGTNPGRSRSPLAANAARRIRDRRRHRRTTLGSRIYSLRAAPQVLGARSMRSTPSGPCSNASSAR